MNFPPEEFKSDCARWEGYRPCEVQDNTGQPDCTECPEYWPEVPEHNVAVAEYDPA